MATPEDVLNGVAAAMENAVPELSTVLHREAGPEDNTVRFPHGELVIVSNIRADQWNTDLVDYATDDSGNRIGRIYEAKFDTEIQMNIWLAVPNDSYDIVSLGSSLEHGLYRYDANRRDPDPLPDGVGGTMTDVSEFRIMEGSELPTEFGNSPPLRGYGATVAVSFVDRINTAEEYESSDYVAEVDAPNAGDYTGGDNVAIEYVIQ